MKPYVACQVVRGPNGQHETCKWWVLHKSKRKQLKVWLYIVAESLAHAQRLDCSLLVTGFHVSG